MQKQAPCSSGGLVLSVLGLSSFHDILGSEYPIRTYLEFLPINPNQAQVSYMILGTDSQYIQLKYALSTLSTWKIGTCRVRSKGYLQGLVASRGCGRSAVLDK
ncbi:hypothetical protein M422DRAFT_23408 [Sphaerobolus stellatus SS14]|nr:hypothetical protein M422DRAFT_23408 [Sphaerobolus stellatus SS14]